MSAKLFAINFITIFRRKDTNRLRTIHPNETVGAVPVCPPERPRSGVSILKIHALCARNLTMDAPLWGALAGTQARPLPLLQRNCSFFFPCFNYLPQGGRRKRPTEGYCFAYSRSTD